MKPEPKFSMDDENLIIIMPNGTRHTVPGGVLRAVMMMPPDARLALLNFLEFAGEYADAEDD